jgi:hypothetical protein
MESSSPCNSLIGHSLKWRCCSLHGLTHISFDKTQFWPLGRDQSSFRLSAPIRHAATLSDTMTTYPFILILDYFLRGTVTTDILFLCPNFFVWLHCIKKITFVFFLHFCLFLFLPVVFSRVALFWIYGIPCKPSADCSWFLGPRCAHSPVQRKTIWLMAVTEDSANEGQPLPEWGKWGHYLTGE